MKHRGFCLFAILLLTLDAKAATTTWAATNVGPAKSTDGGATWQLVNVTVSNTLLQGIPDVVAIAVDPLNANNVYFLAAVTGSTGFYKSTNGGSAWSAVIITGISVGSGTQALYWLCIDPVATDHLYTEASNKVLRSTDAGATWGSTPALDTTIGLTGATGLATDAKISGVVYVASSSGGASKSTDFGNTWTSVKMPSSVAPALGGIFVDPANGQNVYVARRSGQGCADASRQVFDCGLFRSADGGNTFQAIAIPGTAKGVAFDRITGDIYAGASVVLKSSDHGVTWTPLIKGAGGVADGPAVSADPSVAGNIYSLGDQGVGGLFQKTSDGGTTWKKVTLPAYCTVSSSTCPGSAQGIPRVNDMAYTAPPPPPAVSVAQTISAASQQPGPVAAESIVIAIGSHIATGSATGDYDLPATTLAGTTINVTDSSGVTRPAVLFSISATQVTYQIPPGTATGLATVTITASDGVTGSVKVQVAAVSPGLYTLNAAGLVKAYVLRTSNGNQFIEDVFDIDPTGAVIARPVTISNGDLIAYGTGFRAAGGDIGVTIGGVSAPILYAGPQGVQSGLDQFNILIPPEVATGGPQSVPIVLTAGGQTANTVNVTVQ